MIAQNDERFDPNWSRGQDGNWVWKGYERFVLELCRKIGPETDSLAALYNAVIQAESPRFEGMRLFGECRVV